MYGWIVGISVALLLVAGRGESKDITCWQKLVQMEDEKAELKNCAEMKKKNEVNDVRHERTKITRDDEMKLGPAVSATIAVVPDEYVCGLGLVGGKWHSNCMQRSNCERNDFPITSTCSKVTWRNLFDNYWAAMCCCTTDGCNHPNNTAFASALNSNKKKCWKKDNNRDIAKSIDCERQFDGCMMEKVNGEWSSSKCHNLDYCKYNDKIPITSDCSISKMNKTKNENGELESCCCTEDHCNKAVPLDHPASLSVLLVVAVMAAVKWRL